MLGCAISSSSIAVASRCAFVRTGTGVALTQNVTNPNLGPMALDYLQLGHTPDRVMQLLHQADSAIQWRQLGVLDARGEGITFSGQESLGIHCTQVNRGCLAMGNLLANEDVPQAMVDAFLSSKGHLASRLLEALSAGSKAGGEMGPVYSAGVQVCADQHWPVVDLRVDWHIDPIHELNMIWGNYEPQMQAYITRAQDPLNAERYGVPGDP
ncbi:DUF1028 domain-containing protein [Marinobacterium sp. YM272]|uniref:DUF1028 domain-containing protein n=1 Tax=Marinobacterium sp. YM272 TaxID=3421654 RepID=UPI003D7F206B